MKSENISLQQFGILVFLFSIGSSILLSPAGLAATTKQDAWIGNIVGVLMGIPIIFLYSSLAKQFPQWTLAEMMEQLLGKWLGKMVVAYFSFFSFIGASTVLFHMGNFIVTQVMPQTPIVFVNGLFVLIILMGVYLGIEVVARAAEILVPWVMFLFFIISFTVSPKIEILKIQPIWEANLKSLLHAGISYASIASLPCIVFVMITPQVIKSKKLTKTFIIYNSLSGICMVIITFLCVSVLGADITARSTFPSFVLTKKINIADFLTRIEAVIGGLWFITIFFKILLYFYASIVSFAQILGLKDYRSMVLPSGLMLVINSLVVYPNIAYAQKWDSTTWIPYSMTIGILLPLLLLLLSKVRKRQGN